MKKILFVINTLGRGGAENALIQLIKKLDKDEYDISLYVILGQGELIDKVPENVRILNDGFDSSSVLSREGKKKMKKHIFGMFFKNASLLKNLLYILSNAVGMIFKGRVLIDKLLWKTLSDASPVFDEKYDLAVSFLEGASAYYVRDYVNADKKAAFIHVNYIEAGYTRKLDKEVYKSFDRIFTVSEDVKISFLNVYPECGEKTSVFENIIDREYVFDKSEEEGGFDDEFDGKRILTIARLTAQKATDISVESMKILAKNGENVRWYVLGDGDLRKRIKKLIDKYGLKDKFILLGVKDNPFTYLKQCDIYVHATKFEGKSMAIREAQILGKPIIVSDCNSNIELVKDNEDALVSGLNPSDISEKITSLLHDESLCEKLGLNAANRFAESDESIKELLSLI